MAAMSLTLLLFACAQVPIDQRRASAELRTAAAGAAATAASAGSAQPGALKFVDRDEHVYFWFPLLAGLSELTFDPRPEIRRSSLEVRWFVFTVLPGRDRVVST